jgi:predicted CopG family antitoxin
MLADPHTTITVRTSTLRALSLYKSGGKSYDDVLKELMEEVPPESFLRWAKEELERPSQSLAQVRKRIGLPSA